VSNCFPHIAPPGKQVPTNRNFPDSRVCKLLAPIEVPGFPPLREHPSCASTGGGGRCLGLAHVTFSPLILRFFSRLREHRAITCHQGMLAQGGCVCVILSKTLRCMVHTQNPPAPTNLVRPASVTHGCFATAPLPPPPPRGVGLVPREPLQDIGCGPPPKLFALLHPNSRGSLFLPKFFSLRCRNFSNKAHHCGRFSTTQHIGRKIHFQNNSYNLYYSIMTPIFLGPPGPPPPGGYPRHPRHPWVGPPSRV